MRPAEIARAAFFAVAPPAAAGGGLALPLLLALAGMLNVRPAHLRNLWRDPPLYIAPLTLFTAWLALSGLWSPYANCEQALRFALTLIFGLLFVSGASADAPARRLTQAALAAALIVLAGLLAIDAATGLAVTRAIQPNGGEDWQLAGDPGRGAAVLTSLVWPLLAMLAARGLWLGAALCAAVAGVLAAQFGQSANLVAFGFGMVAFAVGYAAPRLAILATTGALALWALLAPFLTPILIGIAPNSMPASWSARVGIWRYVSDRILEQPLIGHGLDASRTVTDTITVLGRPMRAIPLHPHSASLQIWYETGAVGALLAAAVLLAGGWSLARAWAHHRAGAAAACGALAAIGVIANVSFGAWQEWWNATMLVAAASVAALSGVSGAKRDPASPTHPTPKPAAPA